MRKVRILLIVLCMGGPVQAQDINVEYDKNRDLSRYKSFSIGGGEIITPKDQRQPGDTVMLRKIADAVSKELIGKGLQKKDSVGDLIVSYLIGSQEKTSFNNLGPLGVSPDNSNQISVRDFQMGSLIIDLNDRSNNLIWRVNATTNSQTSDIPKMINEVVAAGFKKFSLKPKKVKKK
ncbi:MAG TPA: DUF4136 domain-containing protein [Cyclobacteriaceae bacterium]|nr:DUF4136 domain-containing protein [Cyclobacteriaceae bacterium]